MAPYSSGEGASTVFTIVRYVWCLVCPNRNDQGSNMALPDQLQHSNCHLLSPHGVFGKTSNEAVLSVSAPYTSDCSQFSLLHFKFGVNDPVIGWHSLGWKHLCLASQQHVRASGPVCVLDD